MKSLLLIFLLLAFSNLYAQGRIKPPPRIVVIYEQYGESISIKGQCRQYTERRFGFRYRNIGTDFTKRRLLRLKIRNFSNNVFQTLRLGFRWRTRYEEVVDNCIESR